LSWDAHAVVQFEALAEARADRDRVLDRGLVHEHRLEPPLQGGVLLDVLAVLVERRSADAVQLAAGQHGLEEVAGIHGPLGLARADDRVELVDEEDDAALGLFHLVQDGLEALLEFAAVLRAGDKRPHVEGEDGAVLEPLGHVAAEDPLREALDDGGLADAGLADEDGVVLGLAGEDADGAADLLVAADDRVELALPRLGHEVDAVLLEGLVGGLGIVGRDALGAAHVLERLEDLGPVEAETLAQFLQGLGLAGLDQAEEEVLDRDIFVLEGLGLVLGLGQYLIDRLGDVDLRGVHAPGDLGQAVQLAIDRKLHGGGRDRHLLEEPGHDPLLLPEEGGEQVPGFHLVVLEAARDGLRVGDGLARHLGESVEIHDVIPSAYVGPIRQKYAPSGDPSRRPRRCANPPRPEPRRDRLAGTRGIA